MYRYIVDNAITYTPEDFVLYRESPFACWMERLSLENPDHGIPADIGSDAPSSSIERQDEIAETLREEGRNVVLVDWEAEEPLRRSATLEAMRQGADFVVNGQLALGTLSGAANLLMRTSGYSDLGDYLYVPCDTQGKTTLHSAFRLCFLADLLHMLQGQLPPQMLIIRGGSDVVPLETEDHIYHYRAVKQRFMSDMRDFRKHRMPDPAESSHFGRWSDCAHEVIKQRALHASEAEEVEENEEPGEQELPLLAAAEGVGIEPYLPEELPAAPECEAQLLSVNSVAADARRAGDLQVVASSSGTLAEQASRLGPAAQAPLRQGAPGHTPNLAPVMAKRRETVRESFSNEAQDGRPLTAGRDLVDVTLENLEFIGSNLRPSMPGAGGNHDSIAKNRAARETETGRPDFSGEPAIPSYSFPEQGASLDQRRPVKTEVAEQATEVLASSDHALELPATRRDKGHPLDSVADEVVAKPSSVIDRDDSTAGDHSGVAPLEDRSAQRFGWEAMEQDTAEEDFLAETRAPGDEKTDPVFSDSLITNNGFKQGD